MALRGSNTIVTLLSVWKTLEYVPGNSDLTLTLLVLKWLLLLTHNFRKCNCHRRTWGIFCRQWGIYHEQKQNLYSGTALLNAQCYSIDSSRNWLIHRPRLVQPENNDSIILICHSTTLLYTALSLITRFSTILNPTRKQEMPNHIEIPKSINFP